MLVKNGIGTPLLGQSTRAKLVRAGFAYKDGQNVDHYPFRNRPSAVLIFSNSEAARTKGVAVARALGLPESDVRFSPIGQTVADVIVVLGRDYHP